METEIDSVLGADEDGLGEKWQRIINAAHRGVRVTALSKEARNELAFLTGLNDPALLPCKVAGQA